MLHSQSCDYAEVVAKTLGRHDIARIDIFIGLVTICHLVVIYRNNFPILSPVDGIHVLASYPLCINGSPTEYFESKIGHLHFMLENYSTSRPIEFPGIAGSSAVFPLYPSYDSLSCSSFGLFLQFKCVFEHFDKRNVHVQA